MIDHGKRPDACDQSRGSCRVCLKAIRPDEPQCLTHYRGMEYPVCCPACLNLFNRDQRQFMESE